MPGSSSGSPAATEADKATYRERLDFEIDVITRMGFAGYFLIVADFIKWAKANDIPVGPGRGSGAGSAVAWALTITDLDPIALDLLFERFLNPERVSMPDFDIDFCETHRDKVISYVQGKYGRDRVAQIITFGRLKARAVLKDTGRVLQMSYGQVDRLAKLVPNHPTDPWDLDRARSTGSASSPPNISNDAGVRRLLDLAMKLEGLPRHSSTHAAGVVIGDRPLRRTGPALPRPALGHAGHPVRHEICRGGGAGEVRLPRAEDLVGAQGSPAPARRARRRGRFHRARLGRSGGLRIAPARRHGRRVPAGIRRHAPHARRRSARPAFGDIIALVSLYRPGPMDNIPLFGDRKNGRVALAYPHPMLEEVLAETYGIFVYQEQVMQAAQVLAGYSLGEADLLRRAMGKKIQSEMNAQRARFVEGRGGQRHRARPRPTNCST